MPYINLKLVGTLTKEQKEEIAISIQRPKSKPNATYASHQLMSMISLKTSPTTKFIFSLTN